MTAGRGSVTLGPMAVALLLFLGRVGFAEGYSSPFTSSNHHHSQAWVRRRPITTGDLGFTVTTTSGRQATRQQQQRGVVGGRHTAVLGVGSDGGIGYGSVGAGSRQHMAMAAGGSTALAKAAGRLALTPLSTATATALVGGSLAGGLHAISGPDHLAAVLPRCIGQRWWRASRVGALWAFGHGLSASVLGLLGFFLKDHLSRSAGSAVIMRSLASWAEVAVGGSLIAIGALGIKEARSWSPDEASHSLSAAHNPEVRRCCCVWLRSGHGISCGYIFS